MAVETDSVDKYAFIGPASVGKTTLVDTLRVRYADDSATVFIDEGAKIFFEGGLSTAQGFVAIQEQLQDFVLARERVVYQHGVERIVADRSVIDPVLYTQFYDTQEHADHLLHRVADWLPTYTLFILLDPTGVPDDPRPARLETTQQRFEIYDSFREFCIKNNLPYVEVTGPLEERVTRVEQVIFAYSTDESINDGRLNSMGAS